MMEAKSQDYWELDQAHYLPTFKRYPLVLTKGRGAKVWDADGQEYLDVLAGIAVNSVGHCHPTVVKAIQEQAAELIHISNFYVSPPQAELSEKLTRLSGLDRVFFSNSGAESVEGAIKLARKYAHSKGRGGEIISFDGSFHGRTLATIATGKETMQHGFGPMPQGFRKLPFNDLEAVKAAIGPQTAGIIIEPVQGEGGIRPAEPCFLQALRALCDREDLVLIFDEVQTGVARTGKIFAKDHSEVQPDLMTLAKALGAGVPIGAILANERVSSAINFGDHGTTYGGNPLVCRAALASLQVIEDEQLTDAAEQKGAWLRQQIQDWQEPAIREIRGLGLMLGVVFTFETPPLVMEMFKRQVLANATAGNVLRLVPPLNITYPELEQLLRVLRESIQAIKNQNQHG